MTESPPLRSELAGLIAGKDAGWEPAVGTLIQWMGDKDDSKERKYSASSCLLSVLQTPNLASDVHSAVVDKLSNARNDESHPYREEDAVMLLARASSNPSEIIPRIKNGSRGWRHGAINILNIRVARLAAGSPSEAASAIDSAAPVFLDILAEEDDRRNIVRHRLDKAAVLKAFTDWAEELPGETLDALLRSGSREEGGMWMPDEKRGPFAAGVIIKYISKEQPDIAGRLAKHMLIKGKFSYLTAECLCGLGDSAIKPVIQEGMQAKDASKVLAAGFTLAILGPKALDGLFDYMSEQGDNKTLMVGLAMLAGSLHLIQEGSSYSAVQAHLGGLERTLLENTKFKALMKKAVNSGDGQLIAQAQNIQRAMDLI